MSSKFQQQMIALYVAMDEILRNPMALAKRLERGDADSSGSTMRTAGVVALVLAIFGFVAGAVYLLAQTTGGQITTPPLH